MLNLPKRKVRLSMFPDLVSLRVECSRDGVSEFVIIGCRTCDPVQHLRYLVLLRPLVHRAVSVCCPCRRSRFLFGQCPVKQQDLQRWTTGREAVLHRLRGQEAEAREEDRLAATVDRGADHLRDDDLARLLGGHAADLAVAAGVDLEVLHQGYVAVFFVAIVGCNCKQTVEQVKALTCWINLTID